MEHTPQNTYTPHSNSSICGSIARSAPRSVSHTQANTLPLSYCKAHHRETSPWWSFVWSPEVPRARTKRLMVRGSFNSACSFFPLLFFCSWRRTGLVSDLRTRRDPERYICGILATIMLIRAWGGGGGGRSFRKCANAAAEGLYLEVIEKQSS